ncbi:hypothetical protein NP233_g9455 [Leucocoprinus birnbaumii]|uniref:S-adenosyl-L-methionine-dependent methyltransferase n=1 Tax=Leucocoprinus birnbaumii TaxID=56174 RepID=A0AAD5VM21_9AGAR|nr:hypothetical protein NP233_g9455 [Leucocoprinus birnbaumii]
MSSLTSSGQILVGSLVTADEALLEVHTSMLLANAITDHYLTRQKTYSFPKGNADVDRLTLQHQICCLRFGGLYPPEIETQVQALMEHPDFEILDVGCGSSAVWCAQMAQRFPKVKIVGLDLASPAQGFVQHDLTTGFPEKYKNRFGIIHCRLVCQQFPDGQMLVNSMAECLKSGSPLRLSDLSSRINPTLDGLLLLIDGGGNTYGQDGKLVTPFQYDAARSIAENLENPEGHSWHAAWYAHMGKVMMNPTYRQPPEMVNETSLEVIMAEKILIPCGWAGEGIDHGRELGELMLRNLEMVYQFSPMMLSKLDDIPDEVKTALVTKGFPELTVRKMYLHLWYVVAKKSD